MPSVIVPKVLLFSDAAKCCTWITCQELGVFSRFVSNEKGKPSGIKGCEYIKSGWPIRGPSTTLHDQAMHESQREESQVP